VSNMNWLLELADTNPTAQAIAIFASVCVLGMALGGLKIRGVKLGTSAVLFVALVVGHLSEPIDHETLEFVKEFGLILFVFCIGLQLGPGFFASLRQAGLRLNLLALAIVLSGAVVAVVLGWLGGFDSAAVLGVFSGASTNTPSLGAAQQTLASFPETTAERAALPALAYAVTYPLGIVGIIGTLLALKRLFGVDVAGEVKAYESAQRSDAQPLERRTLIVENRNLAGVAIRDVPGLAESRVVVSRIRREAQREATTATRGTTLEVGDRILAVGTTSGLDHFQRVIGRASDEDLMAAAGAVVHRRVVVTNAKVLGLTVNELNLDVMHGANVTRVTRGELEMTAVPSLQLQFGDVLNVVGPSEAIDRAAEQLGNSVHALNETHFVPLFAGIAVGIALGTMPIAFPGLPQPLKLGLAGGPLIVAILVGRLGHVGKLVWHMPRSANLAFRELGIALFFASVGLLAGPSFFATAFSAVGVQWLLAGVVVTIVPLVAVAVFAHKVLAMNYVVLSGLLAGSMTDPPALAFASGICESEAPAVAYATVYPLAMLLRIMVAQTLAVVLCG
jgi:putative transport protein